MRPIKDVSAAITNARNVNEHKIVQDLGSIMLSTGGCDEGHSIISISRAKVFMASWYATCVKLLESVYTDADPLR